MTFETEKRTNPCPRREISAYVDGELASGEELGLELHLLECEICRDELNEHKRLLFALDDALVERSDIELPENFAKIVATNAQCNVEGLRCPVERGRAAFVCGALALVVLIGAGADTSTTLGFAGAVLERVATVFGFFAHLLGDLSVALSVIIRSIFGQSLFVPAFAAVAIVFFGLVSILFFSRFRREKGF